LVLYATQLGAIYLTLEYALRRYPVFAVASSCISSLTPAVATTAVFLLLNLMWLKFAVMWRLSRLWAMLDGVCAPENMLRCLCNSFSISGFWRGWHASFNAWLLRYLYIPLTQPAGVSRHAAAAITFLFTALWHDFEARLLAWAGLNIVALVIERTATEVVARRVQHGLQGREWLWRQIRAAAGAANILMLISFNAIGYGGGLSGLRSVVSTGHQSDGLAAIAWLACGASGFCFACTHVMMELRELEKTACQHTARSRLAETGRPNHVCKESF
jgi:D-alanyl-lipoteichoic acid acyltransferase DltB (MBOAT superfamily)